MQLAEKPFSAAFTGYRALEREDAPAYGALRARLEDAVRRAADEGYSIFYCGGAAGFDLLAGEAVLALRAGLGLQLRCVLPFPDLVKGPPWRERYLRVISAADTVETAAPQYSPYAFHARNRAMVDRSSLVICYFDGRPGGTASTVRYAVKKGVRLCNVCEHPLPGWACEAPEQLALAPQGGAGERPRPQKTQINRSSNDS